MDRTTPQRPYTQQFSHSSQSTLPTTYPQPFPPPTSQPPIQLPVTDPFQTNRDPFLPGPHGRRGSAGLHTRAWLPAQGHTLPNGHPQVTPPQQQSQPLPPPPPTNGLAPMSLPYDPSRRRSLGVPASPPQYAQASHDPLPPRPPFQSRQMPPPSPPQIHSSASSLQGPAPRGPPIASPFAGARDLASFASHRPTGGMSISSMLGGNEETKPQSSPLPHAPPTSTPKSMPPPSPGRARASSMREGAARVYRDVSPSRYMFEERRPASAVFGQDRHNAEVRKEGLFSSPQLARESTHSFRAFQPPHQEAQSVLNGHGPPGRPNSQPVEPAAPRSIGEISRREAPAEGRFGTFRSFEPYSAPRSDASLQRHETRPFQNGHGPTSQPVERGVFGSPRIDRDPRQPALQRFQPGTFGTPMREEQAGLFRPVFHPGVEPTRESIESRQFQEMRREASRSSPPISDLASFDRGRNGFADRPITFEEHQRMEAMQREQQQRKESDGSTHRSLLNISPELNRRGRNSPLPQAVQGAQPRHVGPGGNNPGIKMEFGRMFSGLGSGVGSATPTAGQSVNGTTTPSRLSPIRHVEGGDLVRTAVAEIEDGTAVAPTSKRAKKSSRRAREEEKANGNGRETPDGQRGTKRAKTEKHHHHHHVHPGHHHHHHHEGVDNGPSPFNMLRFPSNPLSHSSLIANPTHHHHHHHHPAASAAHAHPGHHHHHAPRSVPPARKPTTTVMSRRLVEECAKKPRKHLGSQLYTTELELPPAAETTLGSKIKFSSKMKPIQVFDGKENCTYTVRVPREYLADRSSQANGGSGYLEEICKRRQVWGTDIYTDDSDVIAAAVHSGWLRGDFGDYNEDLRELCDNDSEQEANDNEMPTSLAIRPRKPVIPLPDHDAHIAILILPALESYASTNQHHIWSREWANTHDGMSFMIHRIDFVNDGSASRNTERGAMARKQRLAIEQKKRQEAADGLVMFAHRPVDGGGSVRVGA